MSHCVIAAKAAIHATIDGLDEADPPRAVAACARNQRTFRLPHMASIPACAGTTSRVGRMRRDATKMSPRFLRSRIITSSHAWGWARDRLASMRKDFAATLATGHAEGVDADAGRLERNALWPVRGEPGTVENDGV